MKSREDQWKERLANKDYRWLIDDIESMSDKRDRITQLEQIVHQTIVEERKEVDEWIACCECGDSMERTGLYPHEATYYCFGCDKTYTLVRKS